MPTELDVQAASSFLNAQQSTVIGGDTYTISSRGITAASPVNGLGAHFSSGSDGIEVFSVEQPDGTFVAYAYDFNDVTFQVNGGGAQLGGVIQAVKILDDGTGNITMEYAGSTFHSDGDLFGATGTTNTTSDNHLDMHKYEVNGKQFLITQHVDTNGANISAFSSYEVNTDGSLTFVDSYTPPSSSTSGPSVNNDSISFSDSELTTVGSDTYLIHTNDVTTGVLPDYASIKLNSDGTFDTGTESVNYDLATTDNLEAITFEVLDSNGDAHHYLYDGTRSHELTVNSTTGALEADASTSQLHTTQAFDAFSKTDPNGTTHTYILGPATTNGRWEIHEVTAATDGTLAVGAVEYTVIEDTGAAPFDIINVLHEYDSNGDGTADGIYISVSSNSGSTNKDGNWIYEVDYTSTGLASPVLVQTLDDFEGVNEDALSINYSQLSADITRFDAIGTNLGEKTVIVTSSQGASNLIGTDPDFPTRYGAGILVLDSDLASPFVCFTSGTHIETEMGDMKVEALQVGDLVKTADHGLQEICWIGSRKLDTIDLAANPKLRPVRITAGALGNGLPKQDLLVSRQHRMLVNSKLAQRICGKDEVLVSAIKMTEGSPRIYVDHNLEKVEYFHILFDQHQIIYANGAPSESLYTGEEALKTFSPEAYVEIITLFPVVESPDYHPIPARFIPSNKAQKQLIARHLKNQKHFYTPTTELT